MKKIPKERGPYSHSVEAGGFVFVSGQLPIDPNTEEMVEGDIEKLTHAVIDNIEAVLEKENLTLSDVVKCEVFLKNLNNGPGMNKAYEKRFFKEKLPARTTIQAAKLPLDAEVEISCIAYRRFQK